MRKFSDELEHDRDFEVGGELFKWRYPGWDEMVVIFDEDLAALKNGAVSDLTNREDAELTIRRILVFLDAENDSLKRFQALAKRKQNPVPLFQLRSLYRWLLEVTSGRPTSPPSDSGSGGGSSGATSPEESR